MLGMLQRTRVRAAAALCLAASALFSVGFVWTGGGLMLATAPMLPGAEAPMAPLVRRPRSPRRYFSPPEFREVSVLGKTIFFKGRMYTRRPHIRSFATCLAQMLRKIKIT